MSCRVSVFGQKLQRHRSTKLTLDSLPQQPGSRPASRSSSTRSPSPMMGSARSSPVPSTCPSPTSMIMGKASTGPSSASAPGSALMGKAKSVVATCSRPQQPPSPSPTSSSPTSVAMGKAKSFGNASPRPQPPSSPRSAAPRPKPSAQAASLPSPHTAQPLVPHPPPGPRSFVGAPRPQAVEAVEASSVQNRRRTVVECRWGVRKSDAAFDEAAMLLMQDVFGEGAEEGQEPCRRISEDFDRIFSDSNIVAVPPLVEDLASDVMRPRRMAFARRTSELRGNYAAMILSDQDAKERREKAVEGETHASAGVRLPALPDVSTESEKRRVTVKVHDVTKLLDDVQLADD